MNKNIITKLTEILSYYKETYSVTEETDLVLEELLANNVEVNGDSFYCPIWSDQLDGWVLLAGTKEKADMWVLKKILRLIEKGDSVYTMFNGNSSHLISVFKRYDIEVISQKNDVAYVAFNTDKET